MLRRRYILRQSNKEGVIPVKRIILKLSTLALCSTFLVSIPQAMQAEREVLTFEDIYAERTAASNARVVKQNPTFNERYPISNAHVITPILNLIKEMRNNPDYVTSSAERKLLYTCDGVFQQADSNPYSLITFSNHPGINFLRENTNISYNNVSKSLKLGHQGAWVELFKTDVDWAIQYIDNMVAGWQANTSQEQEAESLTENPETTSMPTINDIILTDEMIDALPTSEKILKERFTIEKMPFREKESYGAHDLSHELKRDPISNSDITPTLHLIKKMMETPNYMPSEDERKKLFICFSVMHKADQDPSNRLVFMYGLKSLKENREVFYNNKILKLKHLNKSIELSKSGVEWAIRHIDAIIKKGQEESFLRRESNFEGILLGEDEGSGRGFYLVVVTKSNSNSDISVGDKLYLHSDKFESLPNVKEGQIIYFDMASQKPLMDVQIPTKYEEPSDEIKEFDELLRKSELMAKKRMLIPQNCGAPKEKLRIILGVQDIRSKDAPAPKIIKDKPLSAPALTENDFDGYIATNNLLKQADKDNPNFIVFNGYPTQDLYEYCKAWGDRDAIYCQGFTLSVSATSKSALRVLQTVQSVLDNSDIPVTERNMYKVAYSTNYLESINHLQKQGVRKNLGDFITIYPINTKNYRNIHESYKKAVEVAEKLDVALRKLMPTDFVKIQNAESIGGSGGLFARYTVMFGNQKHLYVLDENGDCKDEWVVDDSDEDDGSGTFRFPTQRYDIYGPWKPEWVPNIFKDMKS